MKMTVKCAACGLIFDPETNKSDCCPYCAWIDGFDFGDEDEPNEANHYKTLRQAKKLISEGLDTLGYPLPKVRPADAEGELFAPSALTDKTN